MKLSTLGVLKLDGSDFVRVKPLLLLTYVALEGSKDRHYLAELFWPNAADPLNSLAAGLKQLRQYAPGAIDGSYTQVSSTVECDATAFLQYIDGGRYEAALTLYQGPFLSGIYLPRWSAELEEWVYGTREFLAGRARNALLRLAENIAATGNFAGAAKRAEVAYLLPGAPELEPEELRRVHTLLAAGNTPRLSRLLKDAHDLGIELSLSTEGARRQLKQRPDSARLSVIKENLPKRGTSFIGREVELTEIAHQLATPECSLLTLTGPGGVGKSRLAIRVAYDLQTRYPDGVYFVPLAALADSSLIASSIAMTIGISLQGSDDVLIQIARHISDKAILLVLDNFEHLLMGAVTIVHLLYACPNLKLLVTSRECLNIEEEWVVPVEGFTMPSEKISLENAARHDALMLFEDRARRARLSFELTPEDLPHVVTICNLVEGLPLGIELAAAWVKMMSCEEIADEIGRTADILTSTSRNVPEQHKSIRAVFEHSWRLLTLEEQRVLRKLSVFQGGFKREAAAEVAGATIPVLASLVNKSLIRFKADGRYDRHPLLYQYTREKLADSSEEEAVARKLYANYYLAYAEEAEAHLHSGKQIVWLQLLETEQANVREALRLTEELADVEMHVRLVGALSWFWWQRGYLKEGETWLEGALDVCAETTAAKAKVYNGAGLIAWSQSLYSKARTYQEENLAIRRTLRDQPGTAVALNNLGIVAHDECDYENARALHSEALAIWRELGHRRGIAFSLTNLGLAAHSQGEYATARSLQSESLEIMRELENEYGVALVLLNLGNVVCEQGEYTRARTLHKESITLFSKMENWRGIAFSLESFASVAVGQGEVEEAARLWGAAEAIREKFGMPLPPSQRSCYERDIANVKFRLDPLVLEVAWKKGKAMSVEEAVAYAAK